MKRAAILCALLALLLVPWLVQAQQPAQRVIIMDPTGTHAASVSGGNLATSGSASVTVDTISHITSAVHVAGIANTVLVNCVTGCSASSSTHTAVSQTAAPWTIAHIAAVVHVQISGRPGIAAHQAGTWTVDVNSGSVTVSGTVAATQSGAYNVGAAQSGTWMIAAAHIVGGSGHLAVTMAGGGHLAVTQAASPWSVSCTNCSGGSGDAVNVFHQSTIRHISSTTHVFLVGMSREAHLAAAQSGAWNVTAQAAAGHHFAVTMPQHVAVTFAGGGHVAITQAASLSVSCSNCAGGSSDAVNVFHQSTIRHISSVTHVAVTGFSREAHLAVAQSGVWNVTAHQGGAWTNLNVGHIAAMLHVAIVDLPRWAHMAVAQSGANPWNVTAHQGGAWVNINIGHQSTVRHVVILDWQRWAHLAAAQSGAWNVTAHQGGQWNIAHVNTVTHVVGNMVLRNVAGTAVTVTGTALDVNCTGCSSASTVNVGHISGAVHIAGISNVSSTAMMACHSRGAFSLTANGVIAGANSGQRIFICGILAISAVAENISIVEGSGSACGTGTVAIIGATSGALPVAAGGGFSAIQAFPWIATTTAGNAVCLIKSGVGTVAGVITYRGAP